MDQEERFHALWQAVTFDDAPMLDALMVAPPARGYSDRGVPWDGTEEMRFGLLRSMADERGRGLLALCAERGAASCAGRLAKWPHWTLAQAHEAWTLAEGTEVQRIFEALHSRLWSRDLAGRILTRDADGFEALWCPADTGRKAAFATSILDRRAGDAWGMSPLAAAAVAGSRSIADALIPYSDATRLDERGRSPLHLAAKAGRPGAILPLAMSGWDPLAQDGEGWTPILLAWARLDAATQARNAVEIDQAQLTVDRLGLAISARVERVVLEKSVAKDARRGASCRL